MIQSEGVNFTSKVIGDKLVRSTPTVSNPNICEQQVVLTKEEFVECYKRWIVPFVSQMNNPGSNVNASWEVRE